MDLGIEDIDGVAVRVLLVQVFLRQILARALLMIAVGRVRIPAVAAVGGGRLPAELVRRNIDLRVVVNEEDDLRRASRRKARVYRTGSRPRRQRKAFVLPVGDRNYFLAAVMENAESEVLVGGVLAERTGQRYGPVKRHFPGHFTVVEREKSAALSYTNWRLPEGGRVRRRFIGAHGPAGAACAGGVGRADLLMGDDGMEGDGVVGDLVHGVRTEVRGPRRRTGSIPRHRWDRRW